MREISNAELKEKDLPPPNADWGVISRFALTFSGYAYWGSFNKCAEVANRCARDWNKKKTLPHSLIDLRTCLFFEQRRWRHFGYEPNRGAMGYIHAIVEAIRNKILENERS